LKSIAATSLEQCGLNADLVQRERPMASVAGQRRLNARVNGRTEGNEGNEENLFPTQIPNFVFFVAFCKALCDATR